MNKKKRSHNKKDNNSRLTNTKSVSESTVNCLSEAIQLHRTGKLQQAEIIYRQILVNDSNNIDCLHLLGVVKYQQNENDLAISLINKAISINPSIPSFHNNLGNALINKGKHNKAIKCFEEAIRLNPNYFEAYNNKANTLRSCGDFDLAIEFYKKSLQINPNYVETLNNLGNVLKEQGEIDLAIEHYKKAIEIHPNFAEAFHNLANTFKECGKLSKAIENYQKAIQINHSFSEAYNNLGSALKEQDDIGKAIKCYKKAIELNPNYVEAHSNLGNVFRENGKINDALKHCQKAIELNPNCAEALNNLGNILKDYGNLDEAISYFQKAIGPKPNLAEAYNNLGNAFKEQGKIDLAIEHYEKAIDIKPDYADAHYNKSLALLLMGMFEDGWVEYEWRFQSKEVSRQIGVRHFNKPRWDGSELGGKTILVYAEQGFGDTIQFIRYLAFVKAKGGHVIFVCQKHLVNLLQGYIGIDLLIEENCDGTIDIDFDVYTSLLSLPLLLGITSNNISVKFPYLFPNKELKNTWNKRINSVLFKVGLVWAGNPLNKNDRNRSCKLTDFATLLKIDGIAFYSLQKDLPSVEIKNLLAEINIVNLDDQLHNFADTAAVLSNLDLLVSVDTAVAHLAGALGIDVWTMIPFVPDWRWLLRSDKTPWYPSMRLYRQHKPGDWKSVIDCVVGDLENLIQQYGSNKKNSNVFGKKKDLQKKIFVVMPRGVNHGWGVCGRYITNELCKLTDINYVTEPFETKDIGNMEQYNILSKYYTPIEHLDGYKESDGSIYIDAAVIQAVEGISFRPWLKAVKGSKTIGYMFFENNVLLDSDIKWAENYYDIIAVGSTWCKKVLESYGCSKTKTILQGVDPTFFYPVGPKEKYKDRFVIFSGGKFEFRKGQDLVIKAVKIMQKRYKDVFLVVSWCNPWPASLATMSLSSHIDFDNQYYKDCRNVIPHIMSINGIDLDRVISLPLISNAHMLNIYRDTDIGLFPNRCEGGTNLVMMEYMASGRPVIASYLTGHNDVLSEEYAILIHGNRVLDIKHNDRIVAKWEDPDFDEIINKLDWAYHNRDTIKTIGAKGANVMSKFTWRETAKAFYKLVLQQ